MPWTVINHDDFDPEYDALPADVRDAFLFVLILLRQFGPALGRPYVDTLSGSKYPKMKEMRLSADDGEWRFAFAFDGKRQAVILIGGDKSGMTADRFYKPLIKRADARFKAWQKKG